MSITLGAAALIGGLGLLGSMGATGINMWENKKNREFSAAEAKKQRDFEERMSNTAYQRSIKDMMAAGINPAMAYSNGGPGNSTPHGTAAHATGNSSTAVDMINSAANFASVFNYDKNKHNDLTAKETYKAVNKIGKNSKFLTDLDNVEL